MPKPSGTLVDAVAARLEEDLSSLRGTVLPSMAVLCQRYGVSRPTLAAAARQLQSRGMLETGRGRRFRVPVSHPTQTIPDPVSSVARLRDTIARKISEGTYRSRKPIPKCAALQAEHGVSKSTVVKALAELARERMIHKEGRSWCVGRSAVAADPSQPRHVILLAQPRERYWEGLLTERTRRFVDTFHTEAHACQVRIVALVARTDSVAARRRIAQLRGDSGHALRGVLVVGLPEEFDDFAALLEMLCSQGVPVVWFDRQQLEREGFGTDASLTVCRFSDSATVACALESLALAGHRQLSYVNYTDTDWSSRRYRDLDTMAQGRADSMQIADYGRAVEALRSRSDEDLAALFESPALSSSQHFVKVVSYLTNWLRDASVSSERPSLILARMVRRWPDRSDAIFNGRWSLECVMPALKVGTKPVPFWDSEPLLPHLLDPAVTALVCPNDVLAAPIHRKLQGFGIHVPRDITMISFDNDSSFLTLPVSTVDIGAGFLGYQAFHAIMGDIPVMRDRTTRTIVARPTVVERGSVSPLRTRPSLA